MSSIESRAKKVLVLLLCVIPVLSVDSQTTAGNVVGTIRDESGRVVPDVSIVLTSLDTNVRQRVISNEAGRFLIPNVLVGRYRIETAREGFQSQVREEVAVGLGETLTVDLVLTVGRLDQVVTVSGETESPGTMAQIADRIVSEEILVVPQQGRDAQSLVLLAPGVSPTGAGVSGNGVNLTGGASNAFGQVGTSFSSNGARARANSFQIDGIDVNDPARSGGRQAVIQDAVQEMVLLQNSFSAEYGRTGGAIVNLVTKSGTNQYRGSGFWFHQDEGLRSLNNLDQDARLSDPDFREPPFDFDQAGLTIGGPIVRDRTFFFGAYQHQAIDSLTGTSLVFTPTAEGFSLLRQQVEAGLASDATVSLLAESVPVAASATRQSNVNGQMIPVGPTTVNSFYGQVDDNLTFNVDHSFRSGDQLRFRLNYDDNEADVPGSLPKFGGSFTGESLLLSLTELHPFSPNVFSETRFGVNRSEQRLTYPMFGGLAEVSIRELGLQFGPQTNGDKVDRNSTWQLVENLSYFRGRHVIKTGFDARYIETEELAVFRQRGQYIFNSFEDFANNIMRPGNGVKTFGPGLYNGYTSALYAYIQDDFRVGDNLSFNLGLRYEVQTIPGDGYFQGLNSEVDSTVFEFGKVKSDTDNVAPRLGFVWQPPWLDRSLVVRGGFGRSYDTFSEIYAMLSLPPEFVQTVPVRGVITDFLPGGISEPSLPSTPEERRALSLGGIPVDNEFPEMDTWFLALQKELPWDLTMEARYVGSSGSKLPVRLRKNDFQIIQPIPQFDHPLTVTEADALPIPPARNVARPDPASGGYVITGGFGSSSYNAGQLTLRRRFRRGFQFDASYTFSRFNDNMSEPLATTFSTPIFPQDSNHLDADWSRSLYDRPHRFVGSVVWDLALGRLDGPRNLTDGWRVAAVVTRQSGQVYTVLNGIDANNDLVSYNDRVNFNPAGAPGTVSVAVPIYNSNGVLVGYYDSDPDARYLQVGALTGIAGNIPRNSERTPSTWNVDLAVSKTLFLGSVDLELRVEVFNLFDEAQFGIPTDAGNAFSALTSSFVTVSSPNFQKLEIGAGSSRLVQLGLRLVF